MPRPPRGKALIDSREAPKARQGRRMRVGLLVSLLFHVCLLAVLFIWYVRGPVGGVGGVRQATPSGSHATNRQSRPTRDPGLTPEPGKTAAETVRIKLDEVISVAELRDEEENRDQLEQQMARLERISSEQSVEELTVHFRNWLGTKPRATKPAAGPVEGEFDSYTAQIFDVLRQRGDDGRWKYRSVLIDAEGRTMEVAMNESEGQSTYETLQRVKANPLAEKLYRQITLPLLDNLINAGQAIDEAARKAQENAVGPTESSVER